MAKYPDIQVGDLWTADLAASMLPDKYVKASVTDRTADATVDNDPELAGIPLAVGTYAVEVLIFATAPTSATPDLRTQWTFTGTWNNPTRACVGPGSDNTASSALATSIALRGTAAGTNQDYGLPASTGFAVIRELCDTVTVTVAGTLALAWSQVTSDAGVTSVKPGSSVTVRQIG